MDTANQETTGTCQNCSGSCKRQDVIVTDMEGLTADQLRTLAHGADSLISQFGVNVYVDVPETGGELAMWDNEITDEEFLDQRADDYAIPLEKLGPQDYAVKPENGDLILFNARKLHAVLAGEGSDRLTISAFLGYRGDDQPMTVWS